MFQTNQQIGGYTLIKQIGKGGFGEVWLAEKRSQFVTRNVAIKLPLDEQVNFEAIRQEAQLWEQASGHVNVLPIIDADIYDGQVIIVSEYAEGGSLAEKLSSEGKFSPVKAIEMAIGILNGLDFLHSQRIIHRDIKPQNILLQRDTPRLADFGISRAMEGTTNSVTISGTDAYMAPEAFDGKRTVQTDVWSVGVVLYQLLSGRLPFQQPNPHERMFAILTKDYESLPPDIPGKLREIVHKALTKSPENRYQSAKEMRDELEKELVRLKHPTDAPTDILRKPIPFPTDDNKTIEDHSVFIEKTAFPEADKTQPSPVDDKTKFEPSSKPLPTEVQNFLDNKNKNQNQSSGFFEIWGLPLFGFFGLVVFLGFVGIFNGLVDPKKPVSPNNSRNSSLTSSNSSSKNSNSSNLSSNSNVTKIPNSSNSSSNAVSKTLKTKYDEVDEFENGVAVVKLNGKYGLIDESGKEIVMPYYDLILPFGNDTLAPILLNGKVGFIDIRGTLIIPARYEAVSINADESFDFPRSPFFSDGGLAPMKLNGKYGFIDREGDEAIPFKYDKVSDFNLFGEGVAKVKLNEKVIYIDTKGNEVKKPKGAP